MAQSKKHFEEFRPHSKHKHIILRHYFDAWGHKLGLRRGADSTILYVDACAGRGQDELGNNGSPLIAAKAAAIATSSVRQRGHNDFTIAVIAIEQASNHFDVLKTLLAPFGATVRATRGTLDEQIDQIEREFPNAPTLYFIDPFGLEPLNAELVERALRGERNEALLLFADQAALRHYGAMAKDETAAERRHRDAVNVFESQPFLFDSIQQEASAEVAALAAKAETSRDYLDITKESAERILSVAFGDLDWISEIEGTPRELRRGKFIELYCDRLRSWGARFLLPVPIVDETGTRAYTLIHASKSSAGYVAMKEAVTYALKNSPLPTQVVESMRDLSRCDLTELTQTALKRFAGLEVRWASDRSNERSHSVRQFLLESTPVFPFQLEEVKAQLADFKVPGRSIVYDFRVRS